MKNIYKKILKKAVKHLREQADFSMYNGECLYRDRYNNLSCAIGGLITDEHYSDEFEGFAADEESVVLAVCRSLDITPTKELPGYLTDLQAGIHDNLAGRYEVWDEQHFKKSVKRFKKENRDLLKAE